MSVLNYIKESYQQIRLFNMLAGNLPNPDKKVEVTRDSIDNQIKLIREELKETQDEFTANNPVGILDGACDLFVTVAGLLQKLEAQGYDVGQAMCRVDENNLTKFPACPSCEDSNNPAYLIKYSRYFDRFALTDLKTGKVKKPYNFKPVVLDDLVPGVSQNHTLYGEPVPVYGDNSLVAKVTWVTPTFEAALDETVVLG